LSFLSELPEQGVISFPEGIPGFESARRFVLMKHDDYEPILLLQNAEGEKISVPVVPAQLVDPHYRLLLSARDCEVLGYSEPPELGFNVVCLLVLILPGDGGQTKCNLFAPIVINPRTMLAMQLMQIGSSYPSLYPLAVV
jgi:flagellar assembly factor FliW